MRYYLGITASGTVMCVYASDIQDAKATFQWPADRIIDCGTHHMPLEVWRAE